MGHFSCANTARLVTQPLRGKGWFNQFLMPRSSRIYSCWEQVVNSAPGDVSVRVGNDCPSRVNTHVMGCLGCSEFRVSSKEHFIDRVTLKAVYLYLCKQSCCCEVFWIYATPCADCEVIFQEIPHFFAGRKCRPHKHRNFKLMRLSLSSFDLSRIGEIPKNCITFQSQDE